MRPVAPHSRLTTKKTVAQIVIATLTRLAVTNATERSSTRKTEVSCSKFICAQSATNAARTSQVRSVVPNSASEIQSAKIQPPVSPTVAAVIVYQNEVRSTTRRWL